MCTRKGTFLGNDAWDEALVPCHHRLTWLLTDGGAWQLQLVSWTDAQRRFGHGHDSIIQKLI